MSLIRQQKKTKAPLRPNLQTNKYEEKRDEGKATCEFSCRSIFLSRNPHLFLLFVFMVIWQKKKKKVVNQEQKPHR